jgi:glutamyl-tRNA reductase
MSDHQPWVMAVQAGTAGAGERDRLARSLEGKVPSHPDWILLSTCHRVELYGFGAVPDLDEGLRLETGDRAVRHLIRVAAGLESVIVGEDEVLHQVREALSDARAARSLDGRLQRLFETAIAAGRRARAGRTAASGNLAQSAVAWLQARSNLADRSVLVVGAGRMGSALAHSARLAGAEVTIASRDVARANRLAHVYGGRGTDLAGGAELAPKSSAVAVALAGTWHEFQPVEGALPPIADISAPPAVPAEVRARLNGGYLGIDDLYVRPESVPTGYIDEADRVVAAKTREYVDWLDGRS